MPPAELVFSALPLDAAPALPFRDRTVLSTVSLGAAPSGDCSRKLSPLGRRLGSSDTLLSCVSQGPVDASANEERGGETEGEEDDDEDDEDEDEDEDEDDEG